MRALPGPVSKATSASVAADPGHVGDTADVEDGDRPLAELGRQRAMIDRHERRPLPARRAIGRAHVVDDVDADGAGRARLPSPIWTVKTPRP